MGDANSVWEVGANRHKTDEEMGHLLGFWSFALLQIYRKKQGGEGRIVCCAFLMYKVAGRIHAYYRVAMLSMQIGFHITIYISTLQLFSNNWQSSCKTGKRELVEDGLPRIN